MFHRRTSRYQERPLEGRRRCRRRQRTSATLIITALALALALPTAVVVWDIYHDRTHLELVDSRYRELDGLWRVTCGRDRGLLVEFHATHPLQAVGRVRDARQAPRSAYRTGAEIFRVSLRKNGTWRGQGLWLRSGEEVRWRRTTLRRDRHQTMSLTSPFRCLEHLRRAS